MADDTNQSDRTESPTQKRLDDARAKGQVPRSRDLSAAAVVLAGGIGLRALGSGFGSRMLAIMREGLSVSRDTAMDNGWMLHQFERSALQGAIAMAPVMGLLLAAALLAPLAIGGWTFSGQALTPDFARLNPVSGLQRMFSLRGWIELGKAIARFVLVAAVAVAVMWKQFHSFTHLGTEPTGAAIGHAMSPGRQRDDRVGVRPGGDCTGGCASGHLAVQQDPAHDPAGDSRRTQGNRW